MTGLVYLIRSRISESIFDKKGKRTMKGMNLKSKIRGEFKVITDENVIPALNKAVKKRKPIEDMIFHSDRSVQYASSKTRSLVASYKIK